MATPTALSPSTWRVLGLSVAAGYTGLGLLDVFAPTLAANLVGVWPRKGTASPEAEDLVRAQTVLIGARDLSFGIALLALDYHDMPRAMGVVIVSGLVLCVVDVVWIWKARGKGWGAAFGAGATIWAWIGLNLLEM